MGHVQLYMQIVHQLFILALKLFLTLMAGVGAMILHEMGHILAAYAMGVKVKALSLRWKGLYIVREAGTDFQNLIISASGPALNLILMLAFWRIWPLFSLANFCYFGFNILPIRTSDGDRMWGCWMRLRAPKLHHVEGD